MPDGNNAIGLEPIVDTNDYTHAHAWPTLTLLDDDGPPIDPGARLPAALEIDLKWFHDDPLLAGLIEGSGSFGAQLERAECYGYGAIPCRKCGGVWRTRRRPSDGEQYFSEWRDGTGWIPSSKHFGAAATAYPKALKLYREQQAKLGGLILIGDGGTQQGNSAAAALFGELGLSKKLVTRQQLAELFPTIPPELCKICTVCKGIGVVPRRSPRPVQVTARPMGSSVGKAGRHPDTMASVDFAGLVRYEQLDRLLGYVAKRRPVHRLVIASYYGPSTSRLNAAVKRGNGWGGRTGSGPTGGFESIWPFTPTARDWLDDQPGRRTLDEQLVAIRERCGLTSRGARLAPGATIDSFDALADALAETTPTDAQAPAPRAAHADWLSAIHREAWALYGAACANALEAATHAGWTAKGVA